LLWLPLAHSFGKVMLALPLVIGFPTAIDGRVDKIVDNLAEVCPTFMGAVPRIFEKAHARIEGMIAEQGGLKKRIFDWAVGVGLQVSRARQAGRKPSLPISLQHRLADRLVFSTIRERFGGRLRFFISGSAALDRDVAQSRRVRPSHRAARSPRRSTSPPANRWLPPAERTSRSSKPCR